MSDLTERVRSSGQKVGLSIYIVLVLVAALGAGAFTWQIGRPDGYDALALLGLLGLLSTQLREPNVVSRVSFSFLSIILLASGVIVGPFGAWLVGVFSMVYERRSRKLSQVVFNMSMSGLIGASGAVAYRAVGGATDLTELSGALEITSTVGLPILVADVVGCLTNAVLLAGVIHFHQGVPFGVMVRRVLANSGVAYIGYGVIGFLFVILWFPAMLGPFSALLILAPLLAARWAFIQYGDEMRSHERTLDTLVTALGTKEPGAVLRSRRTARLAEWVAEELGLGPHQIGTVRYAATLHEIGHVGVPSRLLRRPPQDLSPVEEKVVAQHGVIGARMLDGIDFLDDARSGIRHQHEHFDGAGNPDGLAGSEIPIAARIVAAAARFEALSRRGPDGPGLPVEQALRTLDTEMGRFDPTVLDALRAVLDTHTWPPSSTPAAA